MPSKLLLGVCVFLCCLVGPEGRRKKARMEDVVVTDEPPPESPPKWSARMRQRHVIRKKELNTFSLSCPAEGHPKPNVTWYHDGVVLNMSATDSRPGSVRNIAVTEGLRQHRWSLRFLRPLVSHSGNYTCQLQNKHGSLQWTFLVSIEPAAVPTRGLGTVPANQTLTEGQVAKFECWPVMSKDNRLPVFWYKHYEVNGSYSAPDGTPYVRLLEKNPGKISMSDPHVLTVRSVTSHDGGWYTCFLGDINDWVVHASAWLAVATPTVVEMNSQSTLPMTSQIDHSTRDWLSETEAESETPTTGDQSIDISSENYDQLSTVNLAAALRLTWPIMAFISVLLTLMIQRTAVC